MRTSHRCLQVCVFCTVFLLPACLRAGPPFKTDDPEPVDFLHWEFYLASQQQYARIQSNATLPHIEINFGAFRNVQLHFVAPMGYVRSQDGNAYGYSDTELGVKYRFVDESEDAPQIGIFPLLEIPTGDKGKQLGEGNAQAYLPLWIQKSWGKFTTYGGGGYWYTPGSGNKSWVFTGWEAQYEFSETVVLGTELYYQTPNAPDATREAGFNLGGFINLNDHDHILFSVGHTFSGSALTTAYLAFQYTV